jgi:hypothetical protein
MEIAVIELRFSGGEIIPPIQLLEKKVIQVRCGSSGKLGNFNLIYVGFNQLPIIPCTQRISLTNLFGNNMVMPQTPSVSVPKIVSLAMAHGNGQ